MIFVAFFFALLLTGLDGRENPGDPDLDSVSGLNVQDGVFGINGLPVNGTDGIVGPSAYNEMDKDLVRLPERRPQPITYPICSPEVCSTCPHSPALNKQHNCLSNLSSTEELLNHRQLEVQKLGDYSGMGPRKLNCLVYALGKPVYHRFINSTYGGWMKDSSYNTEFSDNTTWTTNEDFPSDFYEFANRSMFRQNEYTKKYDLKVPFMGSAHVVFNGSFYYHQKDTANIICYDLISGKSTNTSVPHFELSNQSRLYSEQHNYMDFSVDDNGLWLIYGLAHSNNTIVLKLQEKTLKIESAWNISVVQQRAGEMFIVCGVLYVVDSTTDRYTVIRLALDLFTNKQIEVDIPFTNPFKKTTLIEYNHKTQDLYTWDSGYHLKYYVFYNEHGLESKA